MTQRAIDGPFTYFATTNTTYGRWKFDDTKRAIQLKLIICDACIERQFVLFACCILPNHIHLLVRKVGSYTLSVLMKTIKGRYWRAESGCRVWQPRFNFRIIYDDDRFMRTVEYIRFNYRKMNLEERFGGYPWVWIDWAIVRKYMA